ncbi:hypothetical protein HD554DRAFT_2039954 [Boletus coccyginus]|nr:hypothetical protein HD554DRAFT_2039954 [Boletus coccyginus]
MIPHPQPLELSSRSKRIQCATASTSVERPKRFIDRFVGILSANAKKVTTTTEIAQAMEKVGKESVTIKFGFSDARRKTLESFGDMVRRSALTLPCFKQGHWDLVAGQGLRNCKDHGPKGHGQAGVDKEVRVRACGFEPAKALVRGLLLPLPPSFRDHLGTSGEGGGFNLFGEAYIPGGHEARHGRQNPQVSEAPRLLSKIPSAFDRCHAVPTVEPVGSLFAIHEGFDKRH